MLLRNGEQLLLTLVIPLLLLVGLSRVEDRDRPRRRAGRIDFLTPGHPRAGRDVHRLHRRRRSPPASSAATACSSGSAPRRCPAVGLLAGQGRWRCSPSRWSSSSCSSGVALALGWPPHGGRGCAAALLLLLGTAAFAALGLLLAGTLRAEATLAAANLVYLLLLVGGGVVVPLDKFPGGMAAVVRLLPSGALGEGLRDVLHGGAGLGDVPGRRWCCWSGPSRRSRSRPAPSAGSDSRC